MVDDHVDRPEVEARQRVQLTGTNRSMAHLSAAFSGKDQRLSSAETANGSEDTVRSRHILAFAQTGPSTKRGGLAGLVAIARGKTPDPIPNSAVKTLSADGTAS